MTEPLAGYFRYWGKAGEGDVPHLLPWHALDVAACGVELLRRVPRWRNRLQCLTGLQDEYLDRCVQFFLALHDLGKFSTSFQSQRPDLLARLRGRSSRKAYLVRHDTLGWRLWQEHLAPRLIEGRRLPSVSRRVPRPPPQIDAWMRAVTGHHGRPPEERSAWGRWLLQDAFDEHDLRASEQFLEDLLALAYLNEVPSLPDSVHAASWWLAGFSVLADWLGSNQDFFPYRDTPDTLESYWEFALERARRAIDAAGLRGSPPAKHFTLADCFATPPVRLEPTPLQAWAEHCPLDSGPMLFILEDVTGSGKTEAALVLAQRLLRAGGTGLYFGLPTMATANGMYSRMRPVYRRLFDASSRPSLVLAHGRAGLVDAFRATVLPASPPEAEYDDGTEPAGARCTAWIADNRKKALLADVGVGTIDQALLAVLASRHQSLRLLGLLDKVLVVDEVHACDAYMNRVLGHLLRVHARAGGSAILLSATLPRRQRLELLRAFAEGSGWPPPGDELSRNYPLATSLGARGLTEMHLGTRPEVARRVRVEFVGDSISVEELLERAVRQGQCACWVRNTVDDARDSFEQLRAKNPEWSIELFHARFTLADRLEIERRVVACFGKRSGPEERRARVLIATQVVEQSLDLDFDVMISDLAPIDLLIQRAGRLRRHPRDARGRRLSSGPDRRCEPCLTVLAPPWDETPGPRWLRAALPGTAAVYESQDAHLWRAMRLLREKEGFEMPEDARALVDGVYDADPFDDVPEGLRTAALEHDGLRRAEASTAEYKVLHFEEGYRLRGPWTDEDGGATRLGEPTTTVWLARLEEGRLVPFHGGPGSSAEAWMMSALTLRRSMASRAAVPRGLSESEWSQMKKTVPGRGKWGVLLVLCEEGGAWRGAIVDAEGRHRTATYSSVAGLYISQGEKA